MNAGTLEIQIVAEIAKLQEDMRQVEKSIGQVGKATKSANDNFGGYIRGAGNAGNSSRLAGHHVQNLAFQFQDMFIGLQGGQKPLTVFLQQGSQIAGIMGQAGIGVGGLAKNVALLIANFARAHPILLAIGVAAGAAAAAFKLFQSEIEKSGELTRYAAGLGLTKKEMEELEGVGVTATDVFKGLYRTLDEYLGLSAVFTAIKDFAVDAFGTALEWGKTAAAGIYAGFMGTYDGIKASWPRLPAIIGEATVGAANLAIGAVEKLINLSIDAINALILTTNPLLAAAKMAGVNVGLSHLTLGRIENSFAGAGSAAADAFTDAYSQRFDQAAQGMDAFGGRLGENIRQAAKDRLRAQADAIIADRSDKGGKSRAKKLDEEAKALERAIKASQDYIAALEAEAARIGKSSIEIKKMEIAANAAAAPTEELRRRIIETGQAWEAAFRANADQEFERNVLQPLRDELALLGMVGPQRELAALALEEHAFKAQLARDGITDVNKAWEEYLRLRTEIIQGESALEKDAEAARVLNDQLRDMIGMLGSLGGFGQAIGGLLGLVTGNTRSIGGPIGDLLNIGIGTTTDKDGRVIARTIGDEIGKIFDQNGKFAKTFTSILQGAGTGLVAGNAFGLGKGTGGQLGSAIGGALGDKLGEKFLSKGLESIAKGLGDFAGPLGAIAGGLLGGLIGGLFSKTPWGRVDLSSAGVSGTAGNSGSSERAALAAGNSIFGALQDIADQFGGSVGDFGNISVGVRHGDYRVNTGGTSLKKKKGAVDFDQDAEAAIAYAIQEAIKRGAIDGIRASTQNLLKSSDDLQKNLQKALDFENVFKELASLRDPLGYALDELTREFDRLREIFAEAGASAQEYADLEELLSLKRQEIIDDNARKIIDELSDQNSMEVELLRLLGREEDALALSRLNELAATEAALQPMQAMIYQLQDARAVIDQFGPLAEDLRKFRQELLGDSGAGDSFAVLAAQFRETAELARMGDAGALGSLRGDAGAFLEAAKANASSQLDYRRAVGEVLAATDQGIFAAETQVDYAQLQIDAIAANTSLLADLKSELATYSQRLVEQGEWVERQFRRWEGEGMPLRSDPDNPIYTETAP